DFRFPGVNAWATEKDGGWATQNLPLLTSWFSGERLLYEIPFYVLSHISPASAASVDGYRCPGAGRVRLGEEVGVVQLWRPDDCDGRSWWAGNLRFEAGARYCFRQARPRF